MSEQQSSRQKRIRGCVAGVDAIAISASVGSLVAPHAGLFQALGVCWGAGILGALWGNR